MTTFYSPGTGYFYDDQVSTSIPADVREMDAEERDTLLAQVSEGRYLACGPHGLPVLMEAPPQPQAELAEIERYWRSEQLTVTDTVVTRHRDELEAERTTTITSAQYKQLQSYRQDLRDWPDSPGFPSAAERPVTPVWLVPLLEGK